MWLSFQSGYHFINDNMYYVIVVFCCVVLKSICTMSSYDADHIAFHMTLGFTHSSFDLIADHTLSFTP